MKKNPSDASDFDYVKIHKTDDNYFCCKMEIRVCPEPSYITIGHGGYRYRVSLLNNILFWKKRSMLRKECKSILMT
jgi:hypothetical protein